MLSDSAEARPWRTKMNTNKTIDPSSIPLHPELVYAEEWEGWDKFLGLEAAEVTPSSRVIRGKDALLENKMRTITVKYNSENDWIKAYVRTALRPEAAFEWDAKIRTVKMKRDRNEYAVFDPFEVECEMSGKVCFFNIRNAEAMLEEFEADKDKYGARIRELSVAIDVFHRINKIRK